MQANLSSYTRLKPEETPIVILAEGCFEEWPAKTAIGVIRYGQWPVVAVSDSTRSGKTVGETMNISSNVPIVASLDEALQFQPKALLIGVAPIGGQLPPEWLQVLTRAIDEGLHLINGLHCFLNEEPILVQHAREKNTQLWDVRDPNHYLTPQWNKINALTPRPEGTKVITTVGSDCAVGKMLTSLELNACARQRRKNSHFVATGQTGILIAGRGVPLDRVIGDFMAGYVESCVIEAFNDGGAEWVIVEGQGSLLHPAFSGVTLSLLHGSNPDAMILCHRANQEEIYGPYSVRIPSLTRLVDMYETAASWIHPSATQSAKVVGISLNTSRLSEAEAREAVDQAEQETGLPATDPLRFGMEKLVDGLEAFFEPERRAVNLTLLGKPRSVQSVGC